MIAIRREVSVPYRLAQVNAALKSIQRAPANGDWRDGSKSADAESGLVHKKRQSWSAQRSHGILACDREQNGSIDSLPTPLMGEFEMCWMSVVRVMIES